MHVPMSTPKDSKKRLFPSAQGWGEGRASPGAAARCVCFVAGNKHVLLAPSPWGEGASEKCLDRS
jgi:hypothetical protein